MFIKRVEFHEDGALKALELYHSPGMTNEEFLALVDALATRVMVPLQAAFDARYRDSERSHIGSRWEGVDIRPGYVESTVNNPFAPEKGIGKWNKLDRTGEAYNSEADKEFGQ